MNGPETRNAESLFFVGLRFQFQNVMCDMLIVYFMMNGENLILLIRCTTDGAASIALDLNDIYMSRYCWLNVQSRSRPIPGVRVSLKRKATTPTPHPCWKPLNREN